MIGITISGKAHAAIGSTTLAGSAEHEIVPDGDHHVWLPQAVVIHLLALREPGETFSEVILRLAERGSIAAITR